jgi:hypothetical protein
MSTVDPAAFYTSIFNTEAYKNQSGFITIDYANKTYLKLVGGSIFGSLNIGGTLDVAGTINTTGLFLNDVLVNATATQLNYLAGTTLGTITASKVITVDSSSNINSTLRLNKSSSGQQISFTNGTSAGNIRQELNGTLTFGTTSANDLSFQTNSITRITITSAGLMNILGGWQISGSTVSASATELNYLSGITLGVGTASKVLTLNNLGNVSGINRIGMNNIDIDNTDTTPFSVSGLSDSYGLHLHSQITGTGQNYGSAISFNHSNTGNVVPLSAIVLDKPANQFGELVFYNRNGGADLQQNFRMKSNGEFVATSLTGTLLTASQPNITSLGNLLGVGITPTTRTVATGQTSTNCVWFSTLDRRYGMRQIDTNNFVMLAYSAGGTYNDYITWQHGNPISLNINGTINTTGLYLNNSLVNATATELNYLDFSGSYVLGVNEASKAVILNASRNTSNINNISVNNIGLGNSTDYRSLIDCGNVNAGTGLDRVIGVFNNGTVFSGFGVRDSLLKIQSGGANGIAFYTGSTSSSVGTEQVRISPSTTNIINTLALNGTSITATATELNYLSGITPGLASATKAMVLNASKEIDSVNRLFVGFFPSTLTSIAPIGVNKSGGAFEEIFYCSNGKTRGILNIKSSNAMVFGTATAPLGESPSNLEIAADGTVRIRIDGTTGNISMGTVSFSPAYELDVVGNTRTEKLLVGDSTDTARLISALDSSMGVNDFRYLTFGRTNNGGNQVEMRFCYKGSNSGDNYLGIGFHSQVDILNITNNKYVGIGLTAPLYPLHVSSKRATGDASYNYYYYKGPGSSNGSTTGTPSDVSIRSEGRILVNGEVDVISDFRKKKDIEILDKDYCINFIKKINPKKFVYKNEEYGLQFGYIAQDLIKNNFGELVMVSDETIDEYIDEDGFVSEKDKLYTLSRSQIIAIIHTAVKDIYERLNKLENNL